MRIKTSTLTTVISAMLLLFIIAQCKKNDDEKAREDEQALMFSAILISQTDYCFDANLRIDTMGNDVSIYRLTLPEEGSYKICTWCSNTHDGVGDCQALLKVPVSGEYRIKLTGASVSYPCGSTNIHYSIIALIGENSGSTSYQTYTRSTTFGSTADETEIVVNATAGDEWIFEASEDGSSYCVGGSSSGGAPPAMVQITIP